jgi:hypothetical protein
MLLFAQRCTLELRSQHPGVARLSSETGPAWTFVINYKHTSTDKPSCQQGLGVSGVGRDDSLSSRAEAQGLGGDVGLKGRPGPIDWHRLPVWALVSL